MNKKTLFIIVGVLLSMTAALAQKPVTITGVIPSLPDGTEVIVSDYATYGRLSGWQDETLGKCKIKDGKFSFTFTVKEPRQVVVWVEKPHSNAPIIVVPGDNITIDADKPHALFQADVKGSTHQEAFNKIKNLPFGKNLPEGLTREAYMKQLIKQNASTFYGPLLVYAWSGHSIGYAEFYEMFPESVKNSYHGRALKLMVDQEIAEKKKVEDPAFQAKVATLKRETPKYDKAENVLDAIVAQYPGKAVFVDFWATWCGPCRNAMKTLKPLEPWMEEQGMVRVYLSAPSSDPVKWEQMIVDIGGNHYFMNQEEWKAIGDRYGFQGIPYYRVYNKQGECTFEHTGYPGNDTMKEEFTKALGQTVAKGSVTVTGKVQNMDGQKLTLSVMGCPSNAHPSSFSSQTTEVKDGSFTFQIPTDETCLYRIEGGGGRYQVQFAAQPGETITLNGREVSGGNAALQQKMKEATTDLWKAYNDGRVRIFNQHKELMERLNKEPQNEFALKTLPEYIQYADEIAAWDVEHAKTVRQYMKENTDNIFGIASFSCHARMMNGTQEMYDELSPRVKSTTYGEAMKNYLSESLVGKTVPDFALQDANGKTYTLQDLLKGHEYLVIDFWASWCKPCRRGIPFMREYLKQYGPKGLSLVNISIDRKEDNWRKALDEEGMTWTNLWDNNETYKKFGVGPIPSVFLIDKNGTVIFEKKYGDAIGSELRKVFGK